MASGATADDLKNPLTMAEHAKSLAVTNGLNPSLIGTYEHAVAYVDYYAGSGSEKTTAQNKLDAWKHKRV